MATRIIRIPAFDAEIEWEEVEEKPTEFTPEPHSHEWVDIVNEPDFAPLIHAHDWDSVANKPLEFPPLFHTHTWVQIAGKPDYFPPSSHTHPMSQITGELVTNYDQPAGNRPKLIWVNVGTDTNSPNDTSGWTVLYLPWADQNFSYGLQIGAKYNDNPQGIWWRQTLNQSNSPWFRLWDERNLAISTGSWTPGLTVNNGATLAYGSRSGSFVRMGKMCHVSFDISGELSEGSTIPNNAISINSLPITPIKAAAAPLKFFNGNTAHKIAATASSNLLVFYKYQVSGANIIEAAYTWTHLLASSSQFQISGSISYEIA